jgi:zinc D-Ala-D-Ala dipeptidase
MRRRVEHGRARLRIAAVVILAALTACSAHVERGAERAGLSDDLARGELLRDSALFFDARGEEAQCTVPSGPVSVRSFRHHRYAIVWATPLNCGGSNRVTSGWVSEADVDYADAALAPLLTRVVPGPSLVVAMAYAGDKIFCDGSECKITEPLYGKNRCYLAPAAASALQKAAAILAGMDASLRLSLLDCYRPVDVQIEMFKRVNDPVWVARPTPPRFGGHNRGIAVDLTLEKNGVALDMGAPFDAFSALSNYDDKVVSAAAHANRTLLRDTMIAAGFKPYDAEWWHFYLPVETRAMNFPL